MTLPLLPQAANWLERQWYRNDVRPPVWLLPAASVFEAAVRLRRMAYRRGWRQTERLPVPVVVVGNLTVGGTGKTPLTIWLVECLRAAGYRPGVVSRGYGGQRDRSVPAEVEAGSDARIVGDEPLLIARRTGVPVAVAARRTDAARLLLGRGACDLIIADDGLQHYRLDRDIEIVLIDGERGFGNGRCLPAGPLREPPERANEADFIVRRGGESTAGAGFRMRLEGEQAVNLATGERAPLARFSGQPVRAIAGIANPDGFFRDLRAAGLTPVTQGFPDHHVFTAEDVEPRNCSAVLMTEKDAVKCGPFATANHWYVPIEARLPPEFGAELLHRLRNCPHG